MRFQPRMLFTLAVIVTAAYAVFTSRAWPVGTRLFPEVIGVPLLVLALIQLVLELRQSAAARPKGAEDTGDLQVDLTMDTRVVAVKAGNFFAWLLGFFFCVWLLGFFIAVPLYGLLYLRFQANEGWGLSLVLTVAVFAFFYLLFDQVLHLPWPQPYWSAPEEIIRSILPELPEFE